MIGSRVLHLVGFVAALHSNALLAASPIGPGTTSTNYSCKKVNDTSGRWACQCSGIEDCDRMKEKECIKSTIRCGANGCICTQARTNRPGAGKGTVSPNRAPAATVR